MSEQLTLSAETRDRAGKGASRAIRREGRVPAVIYGDKQDPLSISLDERALVKAMAGGHFMNSVVMVDLGGKQHRTLPKDVQFHPVTDRPLHVDLLRIAEHAKVTVAVPIRFIGEENSPGLKRGGVLNAVRHDIELVCDAAEIPDELLIDLKGLDIGDSLHISQITLPKGTESAITDRDFTVATVVAPSGMKAQGDEEGTPAPSAAVPTVGETEAEAEAEEGAEG